MLFNLARFAYRTTIIAGVAISLSTARIQAQTTCLPADSQAVFVLGNLKAYAVGTADGYGQSVLHLPLLTAAQADSQVVQSMSDSLCAIASQKINASISSRYPDDNLPNRPVYLFLLGNLYLVQTMFQGKPSVIEFYDSNWHYLRGLVL